MNDAVIGLDAVTMVVSGKCPKQIEQRVEKRNKQGQLYLRVDKTKQRDTYNVTIVLPSIIRPTNIRGFSLLDSVKLEYVIDVVKQDLQEILGTNNLEQLIVKKLEINANKSVPSRVNADAITELMARALLKPDAQQIEHCHGVNIHEARTIKTKVIDGFKTARDSTGRYQCKFYRKDRQLDLENKINPTIRMELVYNAKGVSQYQTGGSEQSIGMENRAERKQKRQTTFGRSGKAECCIFQTTIKKVFGYCIGRIV